MVINSFKTSFKDKWTFVYVNKQEALTIIKSLTTQLLEDSPNTGRAEQRVGDHEFFTIAVGTP